MLDGDRRELEDLDAALFGTAEESAAPPEPSPRVGEVVTAPAAPVADDVDLDAALFGGDAATDGVAAEVQPGALFGRPRRSDETTGPDEFDALLGAPVPVAAATRVDQRSERRAARRPRRRMAVVGLAAALVIALAVSATVVFSRDTPDVATTPRPKQTEAPVSTLPTSTTARASSTTTSSTTATTALEVPVTAKPTTTTTAPRRSAAVAPIPEPDPDPGPDPTVPPPPPPPPPPPTDPPTTTTTTTTPTTTTTEPPIETLP